MELRRASPVDALTIAEVFLRARAEMTYLPRLHTAEETHAFFRDRVLCEAEVWVAADPDGRVLGFVAVGSRMLEHLYVLPQAQGRGVGSALLERAKVARPSALELWVFQQNLGAHRFYERHGFELVELTDGASNEERVPDARYAWSPASASRQHR